MTCPSCGGSDRKLIAPGYYRCTNDVVLIQPDAGGPGRPAAYTERCDTQYHAAGSLRSRRADGVCACGTFAIRQCTECGAALCGDHSVEAVALKSWVCEPCLSRLERQRTERRVSAYRQLQPASRDDLADLLTDNKTGVRDGETHQFWDWTSAQVCDVLSDVFGNGIFGIRGLRVGVALQGPDCYLTRTGYIAEVSNVSVLDVEHLASPCDRFNSVEFFPTHLGSRRASKDHLDTDAFNQLRHSVVARNEELVITRNTQSDRGKEQVKKVRATSSQARSQKISGESIAAWGCGAVVVIFFLCMISGILIAVLYQR